MKVVSLPRNGSRATVGGAMEEPKAKGQRFQFARDKSRLFELISFAPLVLGALSINGFYVQHYLVLGLLALAVALSNAIDSLSKPEQRTPYTELMRGGLVALQVLAVLAFVYYTRNLYATAALVVLVLVLMLQSKLTSNSAPQALLSSILIICQSVLLSVLGQFSQAGAVYLPLAVFLGLVPGLLLAAALIAQNASSFERAGWNRVRLVGRKNGEVKRRPAALATLFSMLLIFFPALSVVISFPPLELIPGAYCASVIVLAYTPKIAEAFFEGRQHNEEVFAGTVNAAALMCVLLLFVGAFAASGRI